jgi:DNA-binding MarR family transcriptional regulator
MISSGDMTKRIDRLERAGLVECHPDTNDREWSTSTSTR